MLVACRSAVLYSTHISNTQMRAEQLFLSAFVGKNIFLKEGTAAQIEDFYKEFKGWADEYESAALERRRVILSQLFSRIEIGRGYEVKVEIAMSYKQFLNLSENTQTGNRTVA